ncbi:MAG: FAD:protein FMN transferase [Phycisphaerae bacterium]
MTSGRAIRDGWGRLSQRIMGPARRLRRPRGEARDRVWARFSGRVMGTSYALTLAGRTSSAGLLEDLHRGVAAELHRIEALMSTYRPDSEVSRFNAARGEAWLAVSPETARVVAEAIDIGRRSGGAFDITVGTLVGLWGFGPGGRPGRVPGDDDITAARLHVGLDALEVRLDPPAIRKHDPLRRIDLAGVAKGFGVDRAAAVLDAQGVEDYLLEVGGEIRARGRNALGSPWRVGIEAPGAESRAIHRVLPLANLAVATSGDYRIFFDHQGRRYSHTIDPRTGRPVCHGVTSVTVVHPSCMHADAWATALTVLGPHEGLAVARREKLAALMLVQNAGALRELRTRRMI